MEPISGAAIAKLLITVITITITAISAGSDISISQELDSQAARYATIADAYAQTVESQFAAGEIDKRAYAIEMERARQLRDIYQNQSDIVRQMAHDKRLGAVQSVTVDAVLSLNPAARAGRVIGPVAHIGGQVADVSASAWSTMDAAENMFVQFNPGAPVDEEVRDRVAVVLGQTEDDLVQARMGILLNQTVNQWRAINEQYPNDPDKVAQAFDQVLEAQASRVNDYRDDLVGPGRRFASVDEVKAYLRETAETMQPPTFLFPEDSWSDEEGEEQDETTEPPADSLVPDGAFEETSDSASEGLRSGRYAGMFDGKQLQISIEVSSDRQSIQLIDLSASQPIALPLERIGENVYRWYFYDADGTDLIQSLEYSLVVESDEEVSLRVVGVGHDGQRGEATGSLTYVGE